MGRDFFFEKNNFSFGVYDNPEEKCKYSEERDGERDRGTRIWGKRNTQEKRGKGGKGGGRKKVLGGRGE